MKHSSEKVSLQAQIDDNLKRVYQEALEQDVPDRFKVLLEELRKKESKNERG